jgi:hypothetical protein
MVEDSTYPIGFSVSATKEIISESILKENMQTYTRIGPGSMKAE